MLRLDYCVRLHGVDGEAKANVEGGDNVRALTEDSYVVRSVGVPKLREDDRQEDKREVPEDQSSRQMIRMRLLPQMVVV